MSPFHGAAWRSGRGLFGRLILARRRHARLSDAVGTVYGGGRRSRPFLLVVPTPYCLELGSRRATLLTPKGSSCIRVHERGEGHSSLSALVH